MSNERDFPADSTEALDVGTPAELAREVLESFLAQRFERLRDLLHPDLDVEAGWAVSGAHFDKQATLDGSWVAATSGAYKPEYQFVQSLDADTALVAVHIRYEIGTDLFSERDVAYLMTFKGGLLIKNRIFDSIEDALEAHHSSADNGRD
jgi:hypothetical protein